MSWCDRYDDLFRQLNAPVASYDELSCCAARGLPENCGIRPLTWMLLLHAAPLDRACREAAQAEHLSSYWKFVDMFMTGPHTPEKEHLLQRIQNDIKRTMRVNHLFASDPLHSEALVRILFVFANLWPQIGYVQGLNEIVGPMYYVFRNDHSLGHEPDACIIEADTFYCFMNLISKLHFYIEDMDCSHGGIISIMDEMYDLVRHLDPSLWRHLNSLGIQPAFYSLRWITTIFTREFPLPDSCRLWDTMFTIPQPSMNKFIQAFCCAMLIAVRRHLLTLQHDAALQMLQDYPLDIRIEELLDLSIKIQAGSFSPLISTDNQQLSSRFSNLFHDRRRPRRSDRHERPKRLDQRGRDVGRLTPRAAGDRPTGGSRSMASCRR